MVQYTEESGKLMMLPTDMIASLTEHAKFNEYDVNSYTKDEKEFFGEDLLTAFGELIALGCPANV